MDENNYHRHRNWEQQDWQLSNNINCLCLYTSALRILILLCQCLLDRSLSQRVPWYRQLWQSDIDCVVRRAMILLAVGSLWKR